MTDQDNAVQCEQSGCGYKNTYFATQCSRCGASLGFPNVRQAREGQRKLQEHFDAAQERARNRGCTHEFNTLLAFADQSCAVMNVGLEAADNILRSRKYYNYYKRTAAGGEIPSRDHESERRSVDSWIFGKYFENIYCAALSANRQGLSSYGEISFLISNTIFLSNRASCLKQNAYHFFDSYFQGRGSKEPEGWRSDWENRALLAGSKLESEITPGMQDSDLHRLLLNSTQDREKDDFIEIHIYNDDEMDIDFFDEIRLSGKIRSKERKTLVLSIKQAIDQRGLRSEGFS